MGSEKQMTEDEKLYTLKEACEYLRASRSTILRLRANGELIAHKVGGTLRFYKKDLNAVVKVAEVRNPVEWLDTEGN